MLNEFPVFLDEVRERKKAVLIIGAGRGAISAAKLLRRGMQLEVALVEKRLRSDFQDDKRASSELDELQELGVNLHFGFDPFNDDSCFDNAGLAIISPAVSLQSALYAKLARSSIPVFSELELAVALKQPRLIVVAGSNGKSTCAALIKMMLAKQNIPSLLCKTVEQPATSYLLEADGKALPALWIVEASSYQLEISARLQVEIAVFLNFTENFLERYGTLDRKVELSATFLAQQKSNAWVVANRDERAYSILRGMAGGQVLDYGEWSNQIENSPNYAAFKRAYGGGAEIEFVLTAKSADRERYSLDACSLAGKHNHYNLSAAICAARLCGVEPAAVQEVINIFEPLPHRLESIILKNNLEIINDSKSTTASASLAALESQLEKHPPREIVFLIGGLAKAGSWEPFLASVARAGSQVAALICFGKDAALLTSHCRAYGIESMLELEFEKAVALACRIARQKPERVVIFSPGCASFDRFTDYSERGEAFKNLIFELWENERNQASPKPAPNPQG